MYYIDFDNTLYETGKLTKDVIFGLAQKISEQTNLDIHQVLEDIKSSFNSLTDNFFTLAKKLSLKYNIDYSLLNSILIEIILVNGKNYVFDDTINFLKKIRSSNEKSAILTFVANSQNLSQQSLKLTGSGIQEYVDEVYVTTRYKYKLEIDYKNNIFIDDNPQDLEGLYNSGARRLFRIKRPNNEKRNSKTLNIPETIPTFTSLNSIIIQKKDDVSKEICQI